MKEHPILFSAPMIRAILDGSKTQTRRVVFKDAAANHSPWKVGGRWQDGDDPLRCPYGAVGDNLWVKEGFFVNHWPYPKSKKVIAEVMAEDSGYMYYRADGEPDFEGEEHSKFWTPSPQMPRWASRISLEITEVRIQRLQDISEEDARAEGIKALDKREGWNQFSIKGDDFYLNAPSAREVFEMLWEYINGPGSWEANAWVWAISFKRVTG